MNTQRYSVVFCHFPKARKPATAHEFELLLDSSAHRITEDQLNAFLWRFPPGSTFEITTSLGAPDVMIAKTTTI